MIRGAETGQVVQELTGHTSTVSSLAYSPDDRYIATASIDGTTKLWDAETGKELLTLSGHAGLTTGVSFSPDGKRLATSGQDGTIRIYLLDIDDLIELAKSRLTRSLTTEECRQYLHMERCP